MPLFLYALLAYGYIATPVLLTWRSIRWCKHPTKTISGYLALTSLFLAIASALLAIGAAVYANTIGGFPFYDPRLLQIYRWGLLLTISAFTVSLGGVWRANSLRWLSPITSIGTLVFWFCAASTE